MTNIFLNIHKEIKEKINNQIREIIYKQITEYYEFQEKIKTFFLTGRNPSGNVQRNLVFH